MAKILETYLGRETTTIVLFIMLLLSFLLALDGFGYISTSLEMIEGVVLGGIFLVMFSETWLERNKAAKKDLMFYGQMLLTISAGVLAINSLFGQPTFIKFVVDPIMPFKAWLFGLWTVVLGIEFFKKDKR